MQMLLASDKGMSKMRLEKFVKKGTDTTAISVRDGVPVIEFELFKNLPCIKHGFSTRLGGVSEGCFSSMNLSFTRGDDEAKVMENFRRFGGAVGMDFRRMVFSDQTHTINVGIVTEADMGKGILRPKDYHDIDGLVTNVKNLPLVTFFADCVPLFFVDEVKMVIGLSHSGWRGTAGGIGRETVKTMVSHFGCRKEDIKAAIGPSICGSCYEISHDVAHIFKENFSDEAYESFMLDKGNGKYLLDLWRANEIILLDSGILKENIAVTDICTCCNSDVMWSHRKTGSKRGSLAAFLMLTDGE